MQRQQEIKSTNMAEQKTHGLKIVLYLGLSIASQSVGIIRKGLGSIRFELARSLAKSYGQTLGGPFSTIVGVQRPGSYLEREYSNPIVSPILRMVDNAVVKRRLNILVINKPFINARRLFLGVFTPPMFIGRSNIEVVSYNCSQSTFNRIVVHEATHYCDYVTKQEVPMFDRMRIDLAHKLKIQIKFKYRRSDLEELNNAIEKDLTGYHRCQLEPEAQYIFNNAVKTINDLKKIYTPGLFLSEVKSTYMELATSGSIVGPHLIKKVLPATSIWFEKHFFPKCEEYLRNQQRKKRVLRGLFDCTWETAIAKSEKQNNNSIKKFF